MSENLVLETIKSRRTIHDYRSDPVDQRLIDEALECAIRAPNHKLTNPWRFTQIDGSLRDAIADIAVKVKNDKRPVTENQETAIRKKVTCSPELVVVSQKIDPDPFRRKEDYASCACAIQNFTLALWSEGVGSKWSSGAVTYAPETYALLEIDEGIEEIVAFLWIGYPALIPDPPREPVTAVFRRREHS